MRRIDSIIKKLEQKIIRGTWPVGMRLPSEAKLCEQFEVSRTVVREALEQLRGRHLISTIKGSGSYVNAFSQQDLTDSLTAYTSMTRDAEASRELMDLRILIESDAAAQLAANPDPAAIEILRETIAEMRAEKATRSLAKLDLKFHQALVRACKNRLYLALVTALKRNYISFSEIVYQAGPEFIKQVIDQHERITDAIESGDPARAAEAMREHVDASRRQLEQIN